MPLDSTIEKEWEVEMKRHRDAVKKLNSLSLNKEKDEPEPELDPPYERVSLQLQVTIQTLSKKISSTFATKNLAFVKLFSVEGHGA